MENNNSEQLELTPIPSDNLSQEEHDRIKDREHFTDWRPGQDAHQRLLEWRRITNNFMKEKEPEPTIGEVAIAWAKHNDIKGSPGEILRRWAFWKKSINQA